VHGHQEGSAYNRHYGVRMYHPLVASIAETGDLLDVRLREGNVHSASGAVEFISQLLERVEKEVCEVAAVRMDAGFPEEKLL
ncbi:MAG TPA: transposase, partial [Archangium sp.]|uniref:transposase n=1 Tax=Archangium sp. TaxID=1872627 RepID=UPI002E31A662